MQGHAFRERKASRAGWRAKFAATRRISQAGFNPAVVDGMGSRKVLTLRGGMAAMTEKRSPLFTNK